MKDWSELKRVALRAQPFNSTEYAVASLGSCASDVLDLIAENESLRTSIEYQKNYIESLRADLRESYAIISSPENP